MMEAALWYNADNPEDRPKAVEGVEKALSMTAREDRLLIGEIAWEDLSPEDGRLPEPPFTGSPRCLVGRAEVLAELPGEAGMSSDLDEESLVRLREVTRRVYRKKFPHLPEMTDEECDRVIDKLGPESVARSMQ